jgi:hypothetical protein
MLLVMQLNRMLPVISRLFFKKILKNINTPIFYLLWQIRIMHEVQCKRMPRLIESVVIYQVRTDIIFIDFSLIKPLLIILLNELKFFIKVVGYFFVSCCKWVDVLQVHILKIMKAIYNYFKLRMEAA